MACLPSDHSAEQKVAAAPRRLLDGMRLMLTDDDEQQASRG
jgi:hypothetical protein